MTAILEKPVQRTGPILVQECPRCEVGKPGCPACRGTGKIVRDLHPFVTLGALQEHVGGLQHALRISFEDLYGDGGPTHSPAIGTPAYHLRAIAEYLSSLFQQLVLLLPEEHARTEGV